MLDVEALAGTETRCSANGSSWVVDAVVKTDLEGGFEYIEASRAWR